MKTNTKVYLIFAAIAVISVIVGNIFDSLSIVCIVVSVVAVMGMTVTAAIDEKSRRKREIF